MPFKWHSNARFWKPFSIRRIHHKKKYWVVVKWGKSFWVARKVVIGSHDLAQNKQGLIFNHGSQSRGPVSSLYADGASPTKPATFWHQELSGHLSTKTYSFQNGHKPTQKKKLKMKAGKPSYNWPFASLSTVTFTHQNRPKYLQGCRWNFRNKWTKICAKWEGIRRKWSQKKKPHKWEMFWNKLDDRLICRQEEPLKNIMTVYKKNT